MIFHEVKKVISPIELTLLGYVALSQGAKLRPVEIRPVCVESGTHMLLDSMLTVEPRLLEFRVCPRVWRPIWL
jgi:hypothetical protein